MKQTVKIGEAAKILGVSIDTVRRWSNSGKLLSVRTPGGTRVYDVTQFPKPPLPPSTPPPAPEEWIKPVVVEAPMEEISFVAPKTTIYKKIALPVFAVLAGLIIGGIFIRRGLVEQDHVLRNIPGGSVLATATPSGQFLEVNTDVTVNGNLTANNLQYAAGLDQPLTTTSTPTFANLTLTAGTLVLPDSTQTLTNKSLSGSANTFTNIPNSALANSKVTVTAGSNLSGGGDVSLGGSTSLALASDISITSLTLPAASGQIVVGSGSQITVPDQTGTICLTSGNCPTGTINGSGTANYLAKFSDATTIADSTITDNGSLVTISGASGLLVSNGITVTAGNINLTGSQTLDATGTLGIGTANQTSLTIGRNGAATLINGASVTVNGAIFKSDSTASISGALTVYNTPSIGTTSMADLVLGGATTGGVKLYPNNTLGLYVAGTGNVGIGTTTPLTQFQIGSTTGVNIRFTTSGTAGTLAGYYTTEAQPRFSFDNSTFGATVPGLAFGPGVSTTLAAGGAGIGLPDTRVLAFYTGNGSVAVERMRLDSSGNLGIGTTLPLGTLDLRGNSGITPVASISGQTAMASLIVDNKGIGDLFTASSSGLSRFVITQNGNVGIGTTTPTGRVEIRAPQAAGIIPQLILAPKTGEVTSILTTSYFGGGTAVPGGLYSITNTFDASGPPYNLIFARNVADLSLLSAWSIGIGDVVNSTPPIYTLGSVGIGTSSYLGTLDIRALSGTLPVATVSGATSKAALVVDNSIGDLFTASSSGLSRFVVKQSGNVGIGTTTPRTVLDVVSSSTSTSSAFVENTSTNSNISGLPD
ncbi:MAG: MerR family DNA-binding transcriptional regulator [Patescibacteria group bacterium]|nr:MerR family DNA-binding transcriptional regulator [Patescibacteria group bacterium]MCL5432283.1 MerR family DNA-binding transcriptional regulator [Patescibacteria group bacterium]